MSEALDFEDLDYLERYPDVADAVRRGDLRSGREHYEEFGRDEGRSWLGPPPPEPDAPVVGTCDVAIWSEDSLFLEGWIDDRLDPVAGLTLVDTATLRRARLPAYRVRRADVDQHLGLTSPAELGLWSAYAVPPRTRPEDAVFGAVFRDGAVGRLLPATTLRLPRGAFMEHLLAAYGRRALLGNVTARSFAEMEASLGALMGGLHATLKTTRAVQARATFSGSTRRPRLSLVCVLYGIPDFLYLLVAQFARLARLDQIEFIFVSNSPELEDVLMRDAEIAAFVHSTTVRLMSLNQNCGFSHANNLGIEDAASDTIVVVNPDVFPHGPGAVARLFDYAEGAAGRSVVGAKLYYADGSVMHDGMYFEPERKLTALCGVPVWTVEHFRKGFSDRPGQVLRPVPAITGALMVFDRRFGREIGLFDESFIYGHYEDADLCLRARAAGGTVVLDPALAFWHYEGKGSVKRPEHVGSGLYNRWLFSQRWGHKLGNANDVG